MNALLRRRIMMALEQGREDVYKETFTIEGTNKKIIVDQQYEKFIFCAYTEETAPENYANWLSFFYDGTTISHCICNKNTTPEVFVNRGRGTATTVTGGKITISSYSDVFMTVGDWIVIQIPID